MVHKAHLKQRDPRCDTRVVLAMAQRSASKAADMNAVAGLDADWNLHWPDSMAKNHFNHYKASRFAPVRPCSHEVGSRQPRHLDTAHMKKYRKRVGRRWVVPFTVGERQAQARRMGVEPFWELKSREYGTNPALAERFAKALHAAGGKYAVMTLISMANAAGKMRLFAAAGIPAYPMLHGRAMPSWVRTGISDGSLAGHQ